MFKTGFSLDTGFGDVDPYTTFGAGGYAKVDTDVSYGAPDMQPATATGNGTGTFLSTDTQNFLFGALDRALTYAMVRDQQKMTAVVAPVPYQQQVQAARQTDSRVLTYLAIGGAILFLVTRK